MVQKALAILLAVSWIVLSNVDMSEHLDFESRDTPSASSSPSTAKPVKLASNHVELASRALEALQILGSGKQYRYKIRRMVLGVRSLTKSQGQLHFSHLNPLDSVLGTRRSSYPFPFS